MTIWGDFNYLPYEFMDKKGKPSGFNVELMKAIAEKLDLEVSFQSEAWYEVLNELKKLLKRHRRATD